MNNPKWLNDAVIYNIYPQSFYDTNGDGIGDLKGICEKLDYIQEMGFTAIWLNPIYESPFKDAGYDVADFYKVAPRYGTNEDFRILCEEAKKRDIKVIMDLVAGHTSTECEWFKKSALPQKNEYSNRYIWTDSVWNTGDGRKFISGWSDRDGCYMTNFFYCQPALNYGYKQVTAPWQLPMDHPDCMAMRQELLNIMDYWCDLGANGFRVDMASSLVKEDPDGEGIREIWSDLKTRFRAKHPDGVLIAEWSFPKDAIAAGFDIDFMIHFGTKAYTTLFRYEKGTNQSEAWIGNSYFRAEGKGDIQEFLDIYLEHYNEVKGKGYIAIPTGNHDMQRVSMGRDMTDLKIAYTFLLTMPGVPFVYYGDEIGMQYIKGLPSKEGGFNRTGARTPMQWNQGKNKGFSTGDELYLPVDASADAPTVAEQEADPNSLLNYVKKLIEVRKATPDLCADGEFEVVSAGYPFVYRRGNVLVIVNPKDEAVKVPAANAKECLIGVNAGLCGETVTISGKGAAVIILG
ncbi:MAG: glycosylase [Lachnospiraceae bacterium]|nr:glycosylase [Lachnospiraceae bacterium]